MRTPSQVIATSQRHRRAASQKRRALLILWLSEQINWMSERGNDLAGYTAFYCGRFGRTQEDAQAIYNADLAHLRNLETRAEREAIETEIKERLARLDW
jgi:hypothetical protein